MGISKDVTLNLLIDSTNPVAAFNEITNAAKGTETAVKRITISEIMDKSGTSVEKLAAKVELLTNDFHNATVAALALETGVSALAKMQMSMGSNPLQAIAVTAKAITSSQKLAAEQALAFKATSAQYGSDSKETALLKAAQEEKNIRAKLDADLLAAQHKFESDSLADEAIYLKQRENLVKAAFKEIEKAQVTANLMNKSTLIGGKQDANISAAADAVRAANKLTYLAAVEGANSLKYIQEKTVQDKKRIVDEIIAEEARLQRDIADKTVKNGFELNTRLAQLLSFKDRKQQLLNDIEAGELKQQVASGVQQGVINEFNQRQQLLDKYSKLEVAKREQLVKDLIALEQRKNAQLSAIAKSGASESIIKTASAESLKQYADNKKALLESANAAEVAKSKHIELGSFILLSMAYWRTYNLLLNETKQLLMSVPKVGMELESTRSILSATMGGELGMQAALRGLHEEAKRTGIEIKALRENWRTFSASTIIAGESVKTSWKIFENMNTVITSLHYSGDKATHIFMALGQIFNKSKVQSEELVKQLGNLLPGAFAAFAKAQGMSTMELAQQMKKGLVFAHDTVEKFTEEYVKMFSVSFGLASQSLNANLGRMNTAFTELGEAIYKLTEKDMTNVVKGLTNFADSLAGKPEVINEFVEGLKQLVTGIAGLGAVLLSSKLIQGLSLLKNVTPAGLGATAIGLGVGYYIDGKFTSLAEGEADVAKRIENFGKKVNDTKLSVPLEIKLSDDVALKQQLADILAAEKELADLRANRGKPGVNIPVYSEATKSVVMSDSLTSINREEKRLVAAIEAGKKAAEKYKEELVMKFKDAEAQITSASEHTLEVYEKLDVASIRNREERAVAEINRRQDLIRKGLLAELKLAVDNSIDLQKIAETSATEENRAKVVLANQRIATVNEYLDKETEARRIAIAESQTKELKSQKDFEDKRLALAKKASEDMLKLIDSEASKRINAVDNELKALEQTKDITSTSAYYNAERVLIEKQIEIKKELLKTTKELLGTQQNVGNVEGTPATNLDVLNQKSSSKGSLAGTSPAIMSYLLAKGLSKEQAAGFTANIWEESAFNTTAVGDKGTALGILQWRKDRVSTFSKMFGKELVDATLKEQLDYAVWEIMSSGKEEAARLALVSSKTASDAAKAIVLSERPAHASEKGVSRAATAEKIYGMTGNISAASLDTLVSGEGKVASIEKEIADLEAKKKLTYDQQTASLKTVEEAYAKVTAQYNILTGNIEEGVEQKSAIKYKDALDAVNNALENGNEFEKQRAIFIKWQIEQIDIRTAAQLNYNIAIRATEKELAAIDAQLKQNQALAQIGVRGSLTEMMTNDVINRGKVGTKQKQLGIEEARLAGMLPTDANYDKTVEQIRAIKDELETLAYTSESTMLTISRSIGDSFDKSFRGILDGSMKAKEAFQTFGTSVLKTIQDIILSELKSGIIRSLFGVMTGGASNLFMGKNSPLSLAFGGSSGVTKSEMGNVLQFSKGGIPDIGNNMQYFPLSNGGVGSLRENGKYEAIVPLSRDSSGQLGIKSTGGIAPSQNNVYNINVNVSGTTDKSNANDVGMQVATAIMVQIADARIANANKLGNQLKPLTAFG